MDGFRYGTLTVLSGRPSSGKSTIINQFIASRIDEGQKAFCILESCQHQRLWIGSGIQLLTKSI